MNLLDLLAQITDWAKIASVIVSLLAVAAGMLAKRAVFHAPSAEPPHIADAPRESPLDARLRDVRRELLRQQRMAAGYRWTNNLLTFGQFIIGGILASSFVQSNLGTEWIGTLGVLVLVSSLIRQHYRPDVQLAAASSRVARLRDLLREAEDDLSLLQQGITGAKPEHEIQRRLSQGLREVEAHEFGALQPSGPQEVPDRAR